MSIRLPKIGDIYTYHPARWENCSYYKKVQVIGSDWGTFIWPVIDLESGEQSLIHLADSIYSYGGGPWVLSKEGPKVWRLSWWKLVIKDLRYMYALQKRR